MDAVLVVGGSLAGLAAADTLRREGFRGSITVVEASPTLPADRPPLSKEVLAGTWEPDRAIQPLAGRLDELEVDLRLGERAVAFDAERRVVTLGSGVDLHGDGVVLAVGASPRTLPGAASVPGVHVLRTLTDCLGLRRDLEGGPGGVLPDRVLVVGAGFIGAEVAATCRQRGLAVTLLDTAPQPMSRVFPPVLGQVVTALHRDHGVDVRLGVGLDSLLGGVDGAPVSGAQLADGSRIDAQVVVVGIGVAPNVDWLAGSGLVLDNGIVCDRACRAAPMVVAAGDAARWPNVAYGDELMRVEQWENAISQGEAAARTLLADASAGGADAHPAADYAPIPWFWSDQFDRKMQLAGVCGPDDEVAVVDGSLTEQRFVALVRRGDRVGGVVAWNRPAVLMRLRRRLAEPAGLGWDEALASFGAP